MPGRVQRAQHLAARLDALPVREAGIGRVGRVLVTIVGRRQAVRRRTGALPEPPCARRVIRMRVRADDSRDCAARNFEYLLIADRMDEHTIRDTVESAYLYLETSHEQTQNITQALIEHGSLNRGAGSLGAGLQSTWPTITAATAEKMVMPRAVRGFWP